MSNSAIGSFKYYREFLKFFKAAEERSSEEGNLPSFIKTVNVGRVRVHRNSEGRIATIPLKLLSQTHPHNDGSIVKLTDGEIFIVASQFYDLFDEGMVAHEIGHFLSGHLENPPAMQLNLNLDAQTKYLDLYRKTKDLKYHHKYMRTVFFALLRGGYFIPEFEADLKACEFVDLEKVIATHSKVFNAHPNPFSELEKRNRIAALNKLNYEGKINRTGRIELKITEKVKKVLAEIT